MKILIASAVATVGLQYCREGREKGILIHFGHFLKDNKSIVACSNEIEYRTAATINRIVSEIQKGKRKEAFEFVGRFKKGLAWLPSFNRGSPE